MRQAEPLNSSTKNHLTIDEARRKPRLKIAITTFVTLASDSSLFQRPELVAQINPSCSPLWDSHFSSRLWRSRFFFCWSSRNDSRSFPGRCRVRYSSSRGFCWSSPASFCRDVGVILITGPSLLASLAICAILWRTAGTFRSRAGATVCYWAGVLTIAAAVFHFGIMADELQRIRENCHGAYTPPPPHPLRDMILWSPGALLLSLGLRLSRHFDRTAIGVAVVALWLVGPVILMMVDWLQPPQGM